MPTHLAIAMGVRGVSAIRETNAPAGSVSIRDVPLWRPQLFLPRVPTLSGRGPWTTSSALFEQEVRAHTYLSSVCHELQSSR